MKMSGILGTAAATVLVAGGAIGGYALAQDQPTPEPTVQAATVEPMPEATETPADPTPEATNEPTVTPEPTIQPMYTEEEQIFLPWARENYEFYRATAPRLPQMSDADLLAALDAACDAFFADAPIGQTIVIPGFGSVEELDASTWEDDANNLFLDAAITGYGPNITGTAGSYCD